MGASFSPSVFFRCSCALLLALPPLGCPQVKASLAQQYDAGFQPLLKEAEARHEQELQRVVELQKLVDEKGEWAAPCHAHFKLIASPPSSSR